MEPVRAGALLERLARCQYLAGTAAAMATVEQAVAVTPAERPSAERARALAAHGQMLMLASRNPAAHARCEGAGPAARPGGAPAGEGAPLQRLGGARGRRWPRGASA